jgi:hypothetical protein
MNFFLLSLLLGSVPWLVRAETPPETVAPTPSRLTLAQATPSSAPAVSSQAVATQPKTPEIPPTPASPSPAPDPAQKPAVPIPPQPKPGEIDPLLDPTRPRNSQLEITKEQTIPCGTVEVVLPIGVYRQALVVENPEGRRAVDSTELRRQQIGLGYIRYLSEAKLKVDGQERTGGIDIGIRAEDKLPLRIWYKKMTEPDDVTKAFSFILPPVALIAGAGAWSSGNTLIPDSPPEFTEARDYYLRPHEPAEPTAQPAFRSRPNEAKNTPGQRSNR